MLIFRLQRWPFNNMKSRQSLARVPAALRSFVSSSYRTAGSGQTPMVDLSLRTAEEADYQVSE
jgi:hypothetical protein